MQSILPESRSAGEGRGRSASSTQMVNRRFARNAVEGDCSGCPSGSACSAQAHHPSCISLFFRSLIRKHGLGLSLTTACAREPFGREEGDGSAPIRRALSHDCVEHLTIEELRAGIACDRSAKDFVPRSRFICANITLMMRICVVLDKRSISVNKRFPALLGLCGFRHRTRVARSSG